MLGSLCQTDQGLPLFLCRAGSFSPFGLSFMGVSPFTTSEGGLTALRFYFEGPDPMSDPTKDELEGLLVAYVAALQHAAYDPLDARRGAAVVAASAATIDALAPADMLDTEPADLETVFARHAGPEN